MNKSDVTRSQRTAGLCAVMLLITPIVRAQSPDQEALRSGVSRSFRGEISDVHIVPDKQGSSDPVDLKLMARWGLSYLRNNVHPEGRHGFGTYFMINLLPKDGKLPVAKWWNDGIDGDTELRMLRAFPEAREMVGQKKPDPQEIGLRETVMGYTSDGLYGLTPGKSKIYILSGTSWLVGICADFYERTGDKRWKQTGEKLLRGLMSKSASKDGATWIPAITCDEHGKPREESNIYGPSGWPEPAIRLWETTKAPEALKFADAMAYSTTTYIQPLTDPATAYRPDGSYRGQVLMHVAPALGTLIVGLDTGNSRYIEFGKRVYEHTKTLGTDTGWFPEWQGTGIEGKGQPWWGDHSNHAETCVTGDMAEMAARLGRAGYSECYDDLERMARNYLRWVQFFATPEYEALYRKRNGDKADEGLAITRRLQGGFIASPEPNDLYNSAAETRGANHQGIDMMGCCPPRGIHALYEAWSNTITHDSRGFFVNMSFNRESRDLKIISYAPNEGRLSAIARRNLGTVYLRPPSWSPREAVKAFRNGKPCEAIWSRDYIRFEKVKNGDELTITYPLIGFKQKLAVAKGIAGKEKTYTQTWVGNTIVSIEPRGSTLPVFSGQAPELPRKGVE